MKKSTEERLKKRVERRGTPLLQEQLKSGNFEVRLSSDLAMLTEKRQNRTVLNILKLQGKNGDK
jgi:hypothetical protein